MADDVITLITQDHRAMEALFERLASDRAGRRDVLAQVGAMLVAHSRAEEDEVYPVIAEQSRDLADDVRHSAHEHEQASSLFAALQATDPQSADFEAALQRFVDAVRHHVEEEESEILPSLEEAVTASQLDDLGRRFSARRAAELRAAGTTIDLSESLGTSDLSEPSATSGLAPRGASTAQG